MAFTLEEARLLKPYVTSTESGVFCVIPQELQGMIGAVYARYSRSRAGMREILLHEFIKLGLLDREKADRLIRRILIEYGDDSVQELEHAWLSMEGISNLAALVATDRRFGSFIELSSRYVEYDLPDEEGRYRYYRDPAIMASRHAAKFVETMDFVFRTYVRLIELMKEYFRRCKPLHQARYEIRTDRGSMSYADCRDHLERRDFEKTWREDIRTKACDTLRILLPLCTKTNLGMHANGRTFEHLLRILYSSEIDELQTLGAHAHGALNHIIPRYVERAARSAYLVETRRGMEGLARSLLLGAPPLQSPKVVLLDGAWSEEGQLAAMLYPYTELPFTGIANNVREMSAAGRCQIRPTYIGIRQSRRDRSGRALEYGYPWQWDLTTDLGIYRDLHRHRVATQLRQRFTTRRGFVTIPEELVEAGFEGDVVACIEAVGALYEQLRTDPTIGPERAQYAVLFGHKVRWFLGHNDREAQHLLELRTGPQGHRSYRLLCHQMYHQMIAVRPDIAEMCGFVNLNDYLWPRGDSEARQRVREARLGDPTG